jgi:uncharacterized membrane protein
MKKLITFSTLCIIASLILASCKSTSITKRHYNKGYYVSHTKNKQTIPQTKEEVVKVNKSLYPEDKIVEQVIVNSSPTQNTNESTVNIVASNEVKSSPSISKNSGNSIKTIKYKTISISKPVIEMKKVFSKAKKFGNADAEGDALSLFWIIILVVLILWALGLIVGDFGGFINLLLLVALILLVLWLLRIV